MGKENYIDFLIAKNIAPSLFDDIFISCECGCSKAKGDLYPYVLEKIGVPAKEVIMIGDNRKVDGHNAAKSGIESIIIPNYKQKVFNQVTKFLGVNYCKVAAKKIRKDLYRFGSPYSEYSLLFYLSTRELHRQLEIKGQRNVVFLAREGHFLKRAFDAYEAMLVTEERQIASSYLKCSRRAAQSLMPDALKNLESKVISVYDYLMSYGFSQKEIEKIASQYGVRDAIYQRELLSHNHVYLRLLNSQKFNEMLTKKCEENIKAGRKYFEMFYTGDTINLVDIGWCGRMQDTIGNILGKKTFGYYVGLNNSEFDLNNRKGLLFCSCPAQGVISPYSQILKSNIQLYEQLASAPHGSAVGYKLVDDGVRVEEDWVENEKTLYYENIERIQKELLLNILGLAVWCEDEPYKKLLRLSAKTVLKSGLFADEKRLKFLEALDNGFVWNFNSQTKGLSYKTKDIKVKLDIITSPEKYTRYLVKIQRNVIPKSRIAKVLYFPMALLAYGYVWGVSRLKSY